MNRTRVFAGALMVVAFGATRAGAQQVTDARWRPWLGCWSPAQAEASQTPPVVCVIPASGTSAVEILRIGDLQIASRTRIDADGQRHPVDRAGCTGWDRAEWSADGRRVFVSAEHHCEGSRLAATSVMAMGAGGWWLEVQGLNADSGEVVGVQRLGPAAADVGLPEDVAVALAAAAAPDFAARRVASSAISPAEVIQANGRVSPLVLDAFISEAGKELRVNARELVRLAAAGVPERTIDLVVALANPRAFAVGSATVKARAVSSSPPIFSRSAAILTGLLR